MLNTLPIIVLQNILKFISKHDCFALTSTCNHISKLRKDFEFWKRVISFYGTYYYSITAGNLMRYRSIQESRLDNRASKYIEQHREVLLWLKNQYSFRRYVDDRMITNKYRNFDGIEDNGYERFSLNLQNKLKDITITVTESIPFSSYIIIGGYETSNGSPYLQLYDFFREIEVLDLIYRNYYRPFNFTKSEPFAIQSTSVKNNVIAFANSFDNNISIQTTQNYKRVSNFTTQNHIKSNSGSSNGRNLKIKLSNDSRLLSIGSYEGTVSIYDLEYKKLIWSYQQSSTPITDISWNNTVEGYDHNDIIYGCGEILSNNSEYHNNTGFVKCWDIRESRKTKVKSWTEFIECSGVQVSNDSNYLGYVLRKGIARSIDLRTQKLQSTFIPTNCKGVNFQSYSRNHSRESIRWLPGNHSYLASTSEPRGINIWNSIDGRLISYFDMGQCITSLRTNEFNRNLQVDITDTGLFLLCNIGVIYSINDLSEISLFLKSKK